MEIKVKTYQGIVNAGLLPRDVQVWTPPQYETEPESHFPVIYMHDGQNLFFPEKSYSGVTWGVAEAITRLSQRGFIRPAIVVGIDNTANRIGDYHPTRPYETPEGQAYLQKAMEIDPELLTRDDYVADKYLQLIVKTIKPMIDKDFRTLPAMENTVVMGSSMGGLISIYALTEYPEVFGGAGCISTHWPALEPFTVPYLMSALPEAGRHKLYFDHGTGEDDEEYGPLQKAVDAVVREKGYTYGVDWLTRVAPGARHHESAWQRRIHIPLRFFLGI